MRMIRKTCCLVATLAYAWNGVDAVSRDKYISCINNIRLTRREWSCQQWYKCRWQTMSSISNERVFLDSSAQASSMLTFSQEARVNKLFRHRTSTRCTFITRNPMRDKRSFHWHQHQRQHFSQEYSVNTFRGGAQEEPFDQESQENHAPPSYDTRKLSIPAIPSIEWPLIDVLRKEQDKQESHYHRSSVEFASNLDKKQEQQVTKAIILMDGFSPYHGQYLAAAAHHIYGAGVIHVLSNFMTRYLYQVEGQTDHLSSRLPDLDKAEEVDAWKSLIPSSFEICGIYCESDSGLEDAERLGVTLGLYPRCHDGINHARRDKFLMNQVVEEVGGLDVVKQKACQTTKEAEEFAKSLGLLENEQHPSVFVVVKPPRGVASDDVHLCSNLTSLRTAFMKIHNSPVFGSATAKLHERVLIQEFATGVEYAVDVVCQDGERKVAALWRYDKRAVNGAPFVYFATELVSAVSNSGKNEGNKVEQAVCNYVFQALEALGVNWGICHVECIVEKLAVSDEAMNNEVPFRIRLVEVNCRQHNTDFRQLTNAVVGYNALDMVLAAYFDTSKTHSHDDNSSNFHAVQHEYPPETDHLRLKWDSIPTLPTTCAYGAVVHFVSYVEGTISRIHFDIIEQMQELESVIDMHVYPQFLQEGNKIMKTVDIRSDTGWAHLMNDDKNKFDRDYERLVELMKDMFEVE